MQAGQSGPAVQPAPPGSEVLNREQTIAHLELHGYTAYTNTYDWIAIFSAEKETGRMCKYFAKGVNGPGWDVRRLQMLWPVTQWSEVSLHALKDDELEQLTVEPLPAKFVHVPPRAGAGEGGQRGWADLSRVSL